MKKIIIIFILSAPVLLFGQFKPYAIWSNFTQSKFIQEFNQYDQYVSAKVNTGFSTLNYKTDLQDKASQLGVGFDVDYQFMFKENMGVSLGLGLNRVGTSTILESYTTTSGNFNDTEGDVYSANITLHDWSEKQVVTVLSIPVLFRYNISSSEVANAINNLISTNLSVPNIKLYAGAGFNVKFPVSSKLYVNSGEFISSGYYEEWNVTLHDLPGRFETTSSYKPEQDMNLKPCFGMLVNFGGYYPINEVWECFAGVNMDMGLTNMQKDATDLAAIDSDGLRTYNGMLNSTQINKVKPFNVGLEIGARMKIF